MYMYGIYMNYLKHADRYSMYNSSSYIFVKFVFQKKISANCTLYQNLDLTLIHRLYFSFQGGR
jgi:hypothetical protein